MNEPDRPVLFGKFGNVVATPGENVPTVADLACPAHLEAPSLLKSFVLNCVLSVLWAR